LKYVWFIKLLTLWRIWPFKIRVSSYST